jgi:hypothetical protein
MIAPNTGTKRRALSRRPVPAKTNAILVCSHYQGGDMKQVQQNQETLAKNAAKLKVAPAQTTFG